MIIKSRKKERKTKEKERKKEKRKKEAEKGENPLKQRRPIKPGVFCTAT